VPSRRDQPRKRRPREHLISELSLNYLERYILLAGHALETIRKDYGYDLSMRTFDADEYIEPGVVFFQLKASDRPNWNAAGLVLDLDVRDYNLWVNELMPVFLIVYDAKADQAYWLYVQQYFATDATRRPTSVAKTVRVRLPKVNCVGSEFIEYARQRKNAIMRQFAGKADHHG
jgi:Domain of unknown function (DUF4365)